ncbi:hypothetical protein IPC730_25470 [Pseudomonas aeruginosa]|nr:hypothetical protein IPC738_24225 [Pseudomonas aeruginosa]RPW98513.1 hypothetical protein IPC730_25470 [Pseudomonas aeruginosa]RPX39148.1 hypothetical protein IPC713_29090 [Pseudomonas aeruginosa]RTT47136.1 hypothetical protein DY960_25095 [Pseudomonas aeruginosa]TRM19816.1 hypothetical protein FNL67_17405 [Pseudomonas aeruginosa]
MKHAAEADGGAPSTSSPGRLQSGWHSYCLRSPRTAHHRKTGVDNNKIEVKNPCPSNKPAMRPQLPGSTSKASTPTTSNTVN